MGSGQIMSAKYEDEPAQALVERADVGRNEGGDFGQRSMRKSVSSSTNGKSRWIQPHGSCWMNADHIQIGRAHV